MSLRAGAEAVGERMAGGPPAGVSDLKPQGSLSRAVPVRPEATVFGATKRPQACALVATSCSTTCWSPSKSLGAGVPDTGLATRFVKRVAGEAAEKGKGYWGNTGPRGQHVADRQP